ncbi:DUF1573 domain-containing protein [Roseimicrobium sp. ORNL1]|uniref:DUF1573 domain-containing protein n=1 Tax=Roseimicrobium sp. ORNL1 TaxID=2711231 RepID=UPI0013E1ED77|nr:DUF1573 domain-containing protein [Roseimicrobium sp. ORNL1]QIF04826.1 DUF1573 domain-containing protein [Roseimicrobium sp. ORNL1]
MIHRFALALLALTFTTSCKEGSSATFVAPAVIDLGIVEPNVNIPFLFDIANTGTGTLQISDSSTSCSCVVTAHKAFDLEAGARQSISGALRSDWKPGPHKQQIAFKINERSRKVALVDINYETRRLLSFTPDRMILTAAQLREQQTSFDVRFSVDRNAGDLQGVEISSPVDFLEIVRPTWSGAEGSFTVKVQPDKLPSGEIDFNLACRVKLNDRWIEKPYTIGGRLRDDVKAKPGVLVITSMETGKAVSIAVHPSGALKDCSVSWKSPTAQVVMEPKIEGDKIVVTPVSLANAKVYEYGFISVTGMTSRASSLIVPVYLAIPEGNNALPR